MFREPDATEADMRHLIGLIVASRQLLSELERFSGRDGVDVLIEGEKGLIRAYKRDIEDLRNEQGRLRTENNRGAS